MEPATPEEYRKALEKQLKEEVEYRKAREKEADKIAMEVIELSKKIRRRNKTLFNLIRLAFWMKWGFLFKHDGDYYLGKYFPKRGRKNPYIPLKFVMTYLGVSHRTAQDYVRAMQALDKLQTLILSYVPDFVKSY